MLFFLKKAPCGVSFHVCSGFLGVGFPCPSSNKTVSFASKLEELKPAVPLSKRLRRKEEAAENAFFGEVRRFVCFFFFFKERLRPG